MKTLRVVYVAVILGLLVAGIAFYVKPAHNAADESPLLLGAICHKCRVLNWRDASALVVECRNCGTMLRVDDDPVKVPFVDR